MDISSYRSPNFNYRCVENEIQSDYHHDNAISVGQMGYIQSVCERFEKELGTRDEKYPHGPDGLKVPHLPSQSVPLTPVQRQAYMELVGCLGYAALTRASI